VKTNASNEDPDYLGADGLAEPNDAAEIMRLKSAMTRGFYGH